MPVIESIKDTFSSIFGPSYKVVEEARDNVKGRIKAVEDKLCKSLGTTIQVQHNLEPCLENPVFKKKPNAKQIDMMNAVFGDLTELIGNTLLNVLQFPIGKESFTKMYHALSFNLDINNSCPTEGTVVNKEGILFIQVNMNNAIDCAKLTTWKARILDNMGILIEIALLESNPRKQPLIANIQESLGRPIDIDLQFPCADSKEFLDLQPSVRSKVVKIANTKLINGLLIGDTGITGKLSLCEFPQVVDAFNQKVSRIVISIEPSTLPLTLRYETATIFIVFPLKEVIQGSFQGLFRPIEKMLELRPIRQNAAVQRANQSVETIVTPLASVIGAIIPVQVDWGFLETPELFSAGNYVQVINNAAALTHEMLMSTHQKGFNPSLSALVLQNQSLRQSMLQISRIIVCFDVKNSVDVHWGKSRTLVAKVFWVEVRNTDLYITTNLSLTPDMLPGVGRVIQFKLNPVEAAMEEEKTIQELADNMRRTEELRRQNEIRQINQRNRERQTKFHREYQDYKVAIQDYHNKVRDPCPFCRNQPVSNCATCQGTKLRHRTVHKPNLPDAPSFEYVPEYDPIPDFRSII